MVDPFQMEIAQHFSREPEKKIKYITKEMVKIKYKNKKVVIELFLCLSVCLSVYRCV
jgi:hypothetical protein